MESFSIGQVAKYTGIRVETVRFYEKQGLLPAPARSESGYRQYTLEAIRRIHFIKRAKRVGFTLSEIGGLLDLRQSPESNCADIKQCTLNKIEEIDSKLQDLQQIRNALSRLANNCHGAGDLLDCPILEYLDHNEGNVGDESRTDL